ncbi:3-phosphoserine/phosphohydroxythreonine transaminase [Anaerobiospirillum succiniciproducens]|uniref:3-phosphoserine/phosphohydroxythreonine transaminase n=1 Tax=Anaerobiospirillum succiniciproducens TaxID=13335 RepID=UPI002357D9F6|nr:3-phosphoserine/phosphohydroxythreonine transaminase [Anaerobiospirillum succiniciproducens]MCI6862674.1 3-phosphoserine/phosphohydroxythreonine transaminase [Anaerobiospirillum succiniciproducens]
MRVWNFNPGPSTIPDSVMEKAQAEFLDYQGLGLGIVEMSHRSPEYLKVAEAAEAKLRQLMEIPDDYTVLFEQGGGRGQFAAIPLNLLPEDGFADYFVTGHWSRSAYKECAERFGDARLHECVFTNKDGYYEVDMSKMQVTKGATYAYLCLNETVNGVELFDLPDTGDVPLIADLSSNVLTRPIDVRKFGALVFGAQKNIAPAGLTVTIVRKDLLGRARKYTPSVLDWTVLDKYDSMFNTPNSFAWYMAGLAFDWIEANGGTKGMEERNIKKSSLIYDYIDESGFYRTQVAPKDRSRVNVVFNLLNEDLNAEFLAQAKERHLIGLKGHKVLGGMRASLYNAMELKGVEELHKFMREFAEAHS